MDSYQVARGGRRSFSACVTGRYKTRSVRNVADTQGRFT